MKFKFPKEAPLGKDFKKELSATVENKGMAPAKNVTVDLLLSGQTLVMDPTPAFAPSFDENKVNKVGTETIAELNPGQKVTIQFKHDVIIPDDVVSMSFAG